MATMALLVTTIPRTSRAAPRAMDATLPSAAGVPVSVLRVPGAGHDLAIDDRMSARIWNRVAAFLRTRGSS